jgi:hypothetical protein
VEAEASLRLILRYPLSSVDFWNRDPEWVKNQDPDPGSGSGMNIPDHISESWEKNVGVKNTYIFLFGPGSWLRESF